MSTIPTALAPDTSTRCNVRSDRSVCIDSPTSIYPTYRIPLHLTQVNQRAPNKRTTRRIWHWPNILGIDAALIAVCWQQHFAGTGMGLGAIVVLALSVWLTYMADRLLDVRHRAPEDLLSFRHRFAQHQSHRLWQIWWGILIVAISSALCLLSVTQLRNGVGLLILCLLYTFSNQHWAERFFPKELCVALIFVGGTIIFIENPPIGLWQDGLALACLCTCNCLLIARKEHAVDHALRIRSLSTLPHLSTGVYLFTGLVGLTISPVVLLPWACLMLLRLGQKYIHGENFRILADCVLLLGPFSSRIL